jgi:hypothetical protein
MKSEIKYIELKTGYNDDGPAWIGVVEYSKSGKSMYFNDHCFLGNGHGLCTDCESGQSYWISGIKRNGQDRHWAGTGKIQIEKNIINTYLQLSGIENLDLNKFELFTAKITNKQRFTLFLNKNID